MATRTSLGRYKSVSQSIYSASARFEYDTGQSYLARELLRSEQLNLIGKPAHLLGATSACFRLTLRLGHTYNNPPSHSNGRSLRNDHFEPFKIPIQHPRHKNPYFCGRTEISDKIEGNFGITTNDPNSPPRSLKREIISLYGIGGVGKSEICSQYAHTHEGSYSAVFWINASTCTRVENDVWNAVMQIIDHYATNPPDPNSPDPLNFQNIALALRCCDSSIKSAIEVLKDWLSKESNDRWLLVIDDYNYDNSHSHSYHLNKILPTKDIGHVLVTTRNPGASQHNTIHIPQNIGEKDGIGLLQSVTKLNGLFIHHVPVYITFFTLADKIRR
jgi:hypothetical protein